MFLLRSPYTSPLSRHLSPSGALRAAGRSTSGGSMWSGLSGVRITEPAPVRVGSGFWLSIGNPNLPPWPNRGGLSFA